MKKILITGTAGFIGFHLAKLLLSEGFIQAIEEELGIKAKRNYLEMQISDVPATRADYTLLRDLTGYGPQTPLCKGVADFVAWYREKYRD